MSENTDVKDLIVQINDLKAALRDRDEMILGKINLCIICMITNETELATFRELSENRLKEIEALKRDLKESRCINGMILIIVCIINYCLIVQKEEVIDELKEKMSSLKEKLLEREDILAQYLKETKGTFRVVCHVPHRYKIPWGI